MTTRLTLLTAASTTALLLAGAALLAPMSAQAAAPDGSLIFAQAQPAPAADDKKKHEEGKPGPRPRPPGAPAPGQHPQPPKPPAPAAQPAPNAQPHPPAPTAQPPAARPPAPAAQPAPAQQPRPPAPTAQPAPQLHPPAPAAQPAQRPQQQRPAQQPAAPQQPPAAQTQPPHPPAPAAQQPTQMGAPPAAAQQPPPRPPAPAAQQPAQMGAPPAAAQQPPSRPPAPAAQQPIQMGAPPAAAQATPPAAIPPPPTQSRSSGQFLQQRGGGQPAPNLSTIRQERQETRHGDRVFIREGDRTIVREGDRSFIRHNESNRFAIDARDVRVQQRGNGLTETVIVRPDGTRIVTISDRDGRLIRRSRFDNRGREIVIIDNRFTGAAAVGAALILNLATPVYRGPRERYIYDYDGRGPREQVYEILDAPPIERIDRRYTLDQVRFNAPLRDHMPRVDLDIHFETGSWQLTPEQVEKLAAIADGINRAIRRNPREVFMLEGHTDAVGSDEDNLSLSDRRAESVAVALTEQFQVPAENLVTQGYGEQYLKVQTDGPSEANRRVAVRRITPLLDQQASAAPPPRPRR